MPLRPPYRLSVPVMLLAGALCAGSAVSVAAAAEGITAKPFTPPGAQEGPTMFHLLPPEQTGVRTENNYADPRMWGDRYQEFLFGALGTGVAIGDYDGDGRPDIFAVSKTESCRLFRNLGNWKFSDVTDRAGVGDTGDAAGVWKQGATFADVNNDGKLDIYLCRFDAPNLLYINQGDGTFKEMAHAYGLDIVDSSGMACFCDYDRDGWLDVYIATNLLNSAQSPNGQRGILLHNERGSPFTNVTARAGISGESESHSATWWDYDNDGWPDLYVANDYGVPDKLYHNNRDGTFTDSIDRVLPHTSFSSMGSDLGDVNNDGFVDFLVADMALATHQRDQRGPADAREKGRDPADGTAVTSQYHRNALHLNTGTSRCLEGAFLAGIAITDWTWSVRFEDLDNDGRLDLFVANGMIKEENTDLNTRMMTAETTAERIRIMRNSPSIPAANMAFHNLGDLKFESVGSAWGLDQKGISFGAAFGDLDGDGDLDLVYANYQGSVSVLRNDSSTGHRAIVELRGTDSNRFGVGATVRVEATSGVQVRQLVLARGYMSSSEPILHFGLGGDTTIKKLVVAWPSGRVQTFEDLPADRRFTITEPSDTVLSRDEPAPAPPAQFAAIGASAGLDLKSREEPVDETYAQRLLPMRLNRRGPALAVGDIKGDGSVSMVLGGTTLDPERVMDVGSGRSFKVTETLPAADDVPVNDGPILLFDANGDGKNDLLVTKGGNSLPDGSPEYQPRLFFNDGRGGLRLSPEGTLPALLVNAGAVVAADFDRDGRLDVFLGARVVPGFYPLAPQSVLLSNKGGRFEDVTDSLAPGLRETGMVTAALWSDVDDDGWPDLLLTLDWGLVKYFHNDGGKGFMDRTEQAGFATAGTGWWTSIAAADFNGDGRMDYVVGNVGLNTRYLADASHPALLYSGDFKGDGMPQIVEAYFEGDEIYPRRTRQALGAAIPSILKRFPKNDLFASATLGEILGDEKLAQAQRFAATELRSGVLLCQADGTYRFEPLPRLAQIAPLQGIVAGDFDGDGHADIYAVQNSYAPIPAVGRFDGGLSQLLRGDGHGHFSAVPPLESGLVVPGDAKALVVLDLDRDGWPDFVVTRNNDTMLAFRNSGTGGRSPLSVTLRGRPGNPSAIGARITLEFADGSAQTAEVSGGSGCYSQSTPTCFFGHPNSNPPNRVRVRWPWGAVTEQEPAPNSSVLVISAPDL